LIRQPREFDVILAENLFGDILSDEMGAIAGSIGMLPSASLGQSKPGGLYFGLFEPGGGSAPDIAGKGIANPIAQILSAGMMLRFALGETAAADAIDVAVRKVIDAGHRTGDIWSEGTRKLSTSEMGAAIADAI
jgi:3-isopropylmalate dehydrogenase